VGDICALPPTSLIEALGKRLGLQVFTEDSQFGLLRMALTLAGARFVVDVDLETDAALGDKTEPPSVAGTPQPSAESVPLVVPLEQRGLVRLAKISANHVTPSGDAGKAEYIASVLRVALESHLELWNASHGARTAELETSTRALEATLAELKTLDELAEAASATDADVFADLESLAAGVAGIADDDAQSAHGYRVYPDTQAALFPSFRLLKAPAGVRNPAFRIRPAARGEHVPFIPDEVVQQAAVPAGTEAGAEGAQSAQSAQTGAPDASEPMAVDSEPKPTTTTDGANTTNTTPMCAGRWLLEYVHDVPLPSAAGRGLVVRRTWLIPGDEEAEASAWSPSIKVEGLLVSLVKFQSIRPHPHLSIFIVLSLPIPPI
jgi:hypothetical protein